MSGQGMARNLGLVAASGPLTCQDLAWLEVEGAIWHDADRQNEIDYEDNCSCCRPYGRRAFAWTLSCDSPSNLVIGGIRVRLCCTCADKVEAAAGRVGAEAVIRAALVEAGLIKEAA